jgi:hypothetical protein
MATLDVDAAHKFFTRSRILTPNVSATSLSVWIVTLLSPRSISPTCARLSPERSAKTSWDQPFFRRNFLIVAPTAFWMSCTNSSFGVLWLYPYRL